MPKVGNIGARLDLVIRQGGTFGPVRVTARDKQTGQVIILTGAQIRAHIRRRATDAALVKALNVSIVDAAAGRFDFGLSKEETASMPAGETMQDAASQFVWDLELEDSLGRVIPIFYGVAQVFREVTRV